MRKAKSHTELRGLATCLQVFLFFFFLTDRKQGNEVKVEIQEGNKLGENERTVLRHGS